MSVRSPEPPGGASDRPTLYDLQIRVEDLRTWVEAHAQPGDPLRDAFDRYSEESERTGEPPSAATTTAALAAFASLPADRQREVLNGWEPLDLTPSKEDVAEGARDNDDVHRVLVISPGRNISGFQEWRLRNTSPVEVTIMAGVSKAQAVAELRAILDHVEGSWEEMMADLWCLRPFEQESGSSVTPLTPKLAGTKGEEAGYVTAA
jgi:hypothetical protein